MKPNDVVQCRCGAKVVWMVTTRGKKMPVDYSEKIRVFLDFTNPRPLVFNAQTMVSHFATCPDADKFRKPKKKRNAKT